MAIRRRISLRGHEESIRRWASEGKHDAWIARVLGTTPAALQETDVFLRRLLVLKDWRVERKPSVSWNDLIAGYELRGFAVAVGQGR